MAMLLNKRSHPTLPTPQHFQRRLATARRQHAVAQRREVVDCEVQQAPLVIHLDGPTAPRAEAMLPSRRENVADTMVCFDPGWPTIRANYLHGLPREDKRRTPGDRHAVAGAASERANSTQEVEALSPVASSSRSRTTLAAESGARQRQDWIMRVAGGRDDRPIDVRRTGRDISDLPPPV